MCVHPRPTVQTRRPASRARVSVQVQRQENAKVPAKGCQERASISLTHGRVSPLVLCRLSTDWMKPTPLERAICFTWLMGLNGNHHNGLDENPFHGGLWLRRKKPGDEDPGLHQSSTHSSWWLKVDVSSDSACCVR